MKHLDNSFYTIKQTADLFSVSTKTISRLIHSGELPCVRVGRCVRLPHKQLHEWVEKNTFYSEDMHLACSNYPNCDTEGCGEI